MDSMPLINLLPDTDQKSTVIDLLSLMSHRHACRRLRAQVSTAETCVSRIKIGRVLGSHMSSEEYCYTQMGPMGDTTIYLQQIQ